MSNDLRKTGEDPTCGPCSLPLECSSCGGIIADENAIEKKCEDPCEICEELRSLMKCPHCESHVCCGGCI